MLFRSGVIGLASPPNKNNYVIRCGIINIKEKYCTFDLGRVYSTYSDPSMLYVDILKNEYIFFPNSGTLNRTGSFPQRYTHENIEYVTFGRNSYKIIPTTVESNINMALKNCEIPSYLYVNSLINDKLAGIPIGLKIKEEYNYNLSGWYMSQYNVCRLGNNQIRTSDIPDQYTDKLYFVYLENMASDLVLDDIRYTPNHTNSRGLISLLVSNGNCMWDLSASYTKQ